MTLSAVVFGFLGSELAPRDRDFFSEVRPWGFIVFRKNGNCVDPQQLRALTDSLREVTGRDDVPILIDQEGGPVTRLRPPHWRVAPAAARFGALFALDREAALEAVRINSRLIAAELSQMGINVNCLPVLDMPVEGADPIIGERAYGRDPLSIAELGREAAEGLLDLSVLPVIKHLPGHGRAVVDSHASLPFISASLTELQKSDFAPFQALADLPLGMTAHVVLSQIDPHNPATMSAQVISQVIRKNIGFDGLMMTDDISMGALTGPYGDRVKASLNAGCDLILHCNGERDEMDAVAAEVPVLEGEALRRSDAVRRHFRDPVSVDPKAAEERLKELLARVSTS